MTSPLHTLLQTLTDAVAVGSLYALIALGYTLVYGILQFINFAHGDVFALGAWVTYALAVGLGRHIGNPIALAILTPIGAMFICALVGFCIERFAYKPLRAAPRLNVLITAIGVSLLLENGGQLSWAFGPYPQSVPTLLPDRVLATVAGVEFRLLDVIVVGISLLLMLALHMLIFRTRLGMAMRAVSFNIGTAALMGINVDRIISITFVIGSALAGAAGFLYSMKYPQLQQTAATVWLLLGLKAFIAAVVGGIGNVTGAMLGGLLIGLIEFCGAQYLSSDYRDLYVFAVLILVLLVRPSGLLGKSTVEKV
ncbi:MAG TPA: branched-chain amino acid ABC transporter permease [Tepidisphaeraceae bacterium]|nr:branched-chain amino acid ABC transporter permease [Tepidisphaeraceae bacterium]